MFRKKITRTAFPLLLFWFFIGLSTGVQPATAAIGMGREWRFEAGTKLHELNSGFNSWREGYLRANFEPSGSGGWELGARRTRRYSRRDAEVSLKRYGNLRPGVHYELSGARNPAGRILPAWGGGGGVTVELGSGFNTGLRFEKTSYSGEVVDSFDLTVAKYLLSYRFGYVLTRTKPDFTGASLSHRLQVDLYYSRGSRVGAGIYRGDEVEKLSSGSLLKMGVEGVYVYGEHYWTEKWGLTYGVSWHSQGESYDRYGGRSGLVYRY